MRDRIGPDPGFFFYINGTCRSRPTNADEILSGAGFIIVLPPSIARRMDFNGH